jgi:hypothetical protein
MSANKSQIIGSITRLMNHRQVRRIKVITVDQKNYNRVGYDDNELGLMSADNSWFIPATELTNNELKTVKSKMMEE